MEHKFGKGPKDTEANKYRRIFSSLSVGLECFDKDGVICDMNEAFCNLFCIEDPKEAKDRKYTLLDNPFLRGKAALNLKDPVDFIINTGPDDPGSAKFPYHPAKPISVGIRIIPILDKRGELEGIAAQYTEYADEVKIRAELNENLRKFNYAIKSANIVFWEADTKARVIKPLDDPMLSKAADSVSFKDFLKQIHQDDLPVAEDFFKLAIEAGPDKVMSADVRVLYPSDQKWHYCTVSAIPIEFSPEGKAVRYVGFRKDNTELVQASLDLQTFTDKMNYIMKECGIQTWDFEIGTQMLRVYSGVNKLDYEMPLEEYLNRLEEPDRSEARQTFEDSPSGKIGIYSHLRKLTRTTNDKGARYIIFSGMPIYGKDKQVEKYFGLRRDVTDLILVQKKLEAEMLKAQESERLKTDFLENITHEVRTPLNSIVGFSNLLEHTSDKNERDRYIELINANNDLLLRIIDNTLELSMIRSGTEKVRISNFDFSSFFNAMANNVLHGHESSKLQIIIENPYKRCIVSADQAKIGKIIEEYCSNALKFTSEGHIRIGYRYQEGGLGISIEDTGTGFPPEMLDSIFKPFRKLDSFVQGAGLGLPICKALAELMNGKIGASSAVGQGSSFWAWIPCELLECEKYTDEDASSVLIPDISCEHADERSNQAEKVEKVESSSLNILIVDSNINEFMLAKSYLIGHTVFFASDGIQALNMTRTMKFDVILIDDTLPGMDGQTAAILFRNFDKKCPTILMTAEPAESVQARALESGCTAVLQKPIREKDIRKAISNVL